jgi:hypothetical protein
VTYVGKVGKLVLPRTSCFMYRIWEENLASDMNNTVMQLVKKGWAAGSA